MARTHRHVAHICAAAAEIILVGSLVLAGVAAPARLPTLAATWSRATLSAGVVMTVLGWLCLASPRPFALGVRWTIALLLAAAAGGVALVALVAITPPSDATQAGGGLLLLLAAVGMDVLAASLPKGRRARDGQHRGE